MLQFELYVKFGGASYININIMHRCTDIHFLGTYMYSTSKENATYLCSGCNLYTVLPRCYALLAVTPPPLFSGEITVKGYFTSITRPPPRAARAGLRYCSSARVRVLQV